LHAGVPLVPLMWLLHYSQQTRLSIHPSDHPPQRGRHRRLAPTGGVRSKEPPLKSMKGLSAGRLFLSGRLHEKSAFIQLQERERRWFEISTALARRLPAPSLRARPILHTIRHFFLQLSTRCLYFNPPFDRQFA
jgi:hypothetical protein